MSNYAFGHIPKDQHAFGPWNLNQLLQLRKYVDLSSTNLSSLSLAPTSTSIVAEPLSLKRPDLSASILTVPLFDLSKALEVPNVSALPEIDGLKQEIEQLKQHIQTIHDRQEQQLIRGVKQSPESSESSESSESLESKSHADSLLEIQTEQTKNLEKLEKLEKPELKVELGLGLDNFSNFKQYATYSTCAEIAQCVVDATNAKTGNVYTCDDIGRGKWMPPTRQWNHADAKYMQIETLKLEHASAKPGRIWTCIDDQGHGTWLDPPAIVQTVSLQQQLNQDLEISKTAADIPKVSGTHDINQALDSISISIPKPIAIQLNTSPRLTPSPSPESSPCTSPASSIQTNPSVRLSFHDAPDSPPSSPSPKKLSGSLGSLGSSGPSGPSGPLQPQTLTQTSFTTFLPDSSGWKEQQQQHRNESALSDQSSKSSLKIVDELQVQTIDAQDINSHQLNTHSITTNEFSLFRAQPPGSVLSISANGHDIECLPASTLLWEPLQDMFQSTVCWLDDKDSPWSTSSDSNCSGALNSSSQPTNQLFNRYRVSANPGDASRSEFSNAGHNTDDAGGDAVGRFVASYNHQLYEIPNTFLSHQNNELTIRGKVQIEQGNIDAPAITCEHINAADMHAEMATINHLTCPTIECSDLIIHAAHANQIMPRSGDVLTYAASGKAMWASPTDAVETPAQSMPHTLVQFSDHTGKSLSGTTVSVGPCSSGFELDGGERNHRCYVRAGQFQADCPEALIHRQQTLVAIKNGEQLVLGTSCHSLSFGEQALQQNQTGSGHVALGPGALKTLTSGRHCIAIGPSTLNQFEGEETLAFGHRTLSSLTKGKNNIGLGCNVMQKTVHAHNNVGVGNRALFSVQGSNNTGVGNLSLTNSVASGNTAVGNRAGAKLIYGDSNVCVGDNAGPDTDLTNTIALGRDAKPTGHGHLAMGSSKAPLRVCYEATSGNIPMLNPDAYLCVDINGIPYKMALYLA